MLSIQNPSDSPCSSEVSARKKRNNEKASDEISLDEADLPTSTLDQLDLLSFTIRDYVFQARTKNIKQNWPFPSPYLQLCLDHGVKNVLPPFEPPTSSKPWHVLNSDVLTTKVAGEALDVEDDVGWDLQGASATCVDQLGASSKQQEESTSSRPSSFHQGMLESESTLSNDDLVTGTLLPPKFVSVGRRKPSVVGASQPAQSTCKSKSQLEVDENCGPKPAKKRGDQSSVTVNKECSETKLESGRSEGFGSKLSALLNPMASKVCPVCRIFSSTSNTTLNAHIDQCLASDSTTQLPPAIKQMRHMVKPIKMKSIVEIYATARACTIEHLDRMNGTAETSSTCMVPLTGKDFRENKRARPSKRNSADESDSDALNVAFNVRKVRTLSQLTAEENLPSSKHSKSGSDERGPLTSNKRSLVFSSAKVSGLKTQEKYLNMLTDLENQNYEFPEAEGTHMTCEHQKEKKSISLHEKTEEKISSSGHLKHWVRSKRRVLKRVVCKGKMAVSEDYVVRSGDLSTCSSCDPNLASSVENFVHSPRKGGEICQDATGAAEGDRSTLQKLSYKNCCPAAKKLLTLGNKFSSKRLNIAKKGSKAKDVFPREIQEEIPSQRSGKQLEHVCHIDKRCSRTCNFGDPAPLEAAKESCSFGCSNDHLETKNSKLEKLLSLVEDTALDSEKKWSNRDPLTMKKPSDPNESPHDTVHCGDAPHYMRFDGAKEPHSDEGTLDVHNSQAPTAYNIGNPTKVTFYREMGTVSAECLPSDGETHSESCMEDQPGSLQFELSREDSSFSNEESNKAAYDTSQTVDEKIDGKNKHNVSEAEAFISEVTTSMCQGKGENLTSSQEDVLNDAFVGKSSVEQNMQVNSACLNFIGSEYQRKLFDILAAQVNPTSNRLGTRVSTVGDPKCRVFEPESFRGPSKMNLCSQCQDSDSTRKSTINFFQDQLASSNGIPGRQDISPDLHFEASMVLTGTQPFHVNKTGHCQGYHTSMDQQMEGICCRVSCAVSAGQQIVAQNNNSYQLLVDGCLHGENEFHSSTCLSDLASELPQNLQAAIADKTANISAPSPFLGVPTKSQTDALQRLNGGTATQVSDQCQVRPTANCVLRLMGKNLVVAKKGEADAVQQHVSTYRTINHPNSEYVRNLGFSGTCGCNPNQLLSNPSVHDDPFVLTHFQHEILSGSGNFGNPRFHSLSTHPNNCCDIHSGGLARSSLPTVYGVKCENHFQHRTLFQICGQLNSLNVQNLEYGHKFGKEALAYFGARAAQEAIILDDSPEPCSSD